MTSVEPRAGQHVCAACVGEEFLNAEVQKSGHDGSCSFCQSAGRTFPVDWISDVVGNALRDHFRLVDRVEDEDSPPTGRPIVEVIASMAGLDDTVAEAIRSALAERDAEKQESMGWDAFDIGPFDGTALYTERSQVDDIDFHSDWYEFERILKTKARHFNRKAESVLWSVFDGIDSERTEDGKPLIVDAGPGTDLTALFRARVFQSVDDLRVALKNPDKEIGTPPYLRATAGRMNARGISVFYGATEAQTALAEVRPPVGSQVIVGRFDLIRPFRLLDLRHLQSIGTEQGSVFDPAHTQRLKRARFSKWLTGRMTMAVMPHDEPLDYLATQAIADFLSTTLDPRLDGIIYPSVQIHQPCLQSGLGRRVHHEYLNVVLFNSSAHVRPMGIPPDAVVSVSDGSDYVRDHLEKGPEVKYSVWERVPGGAAGFVETNFYDNETASAHYDLQLDLASLEVHFVTGVAITTKVNSASRHRHIAPKPVGESPEAQ